MVAGQSDGIELIPRMVGGIMAVLSGYLIGA